MKKKSILSARSQASKGKFYQIFAPPHFNFVSHEMRRIWSAAVSAALGHSAWDVRTIFGGRSSNVVRTKAVQSSTLQIPPVR